MQHWQSYITQKYPNHQNETNAIWYIHRLERAQVTASDTNNIIKWTYFSFNTKNAFLDCGPDTTLLAKKGYCWKRLNLESSQQQCTVTSDLYYQSQVKLIQLSSHHHQLISYKCGSLLSVSSVVYPALGVLTPGLLELKTHHTNKNSGC